MNSEELELSLKTEFENYIDGVRAELKQELSDFQKMVETEVDKHRSQLDDAFRNFSARLESEKGLNEALKETVGEHLRLARDDGAQLAASAAAEAEMLSVGSGSAGIGSFEIIRDAINEISGKTSQSAILKSLTDHCSRLSERGAFFIIKNDNFVGWQVFGNDVDVTGSTAKDIHFPVATDTVLARSVNELQTVVASFSEHSGDSNFLKSLKFGTPSRMFAVPLVARGRGVAVLYADGGPLDKPVAIEAIEALVRVAGLTVELLASAPVARPVNEAPAQETVSPVNYEQPQQAAYFQTVETAASEPAVTPELTDTVPVVVNEDLDDESYLMTETEHVIEAETVSSLQNVPEDEPAPIVSESPAGFAFTSVPVEPEPVQDAPSEPATQSFTTEMPAFGSEVQANGNGRPRRGRNVDLPIEVPEEEKDKHKKARSFARLLVSEIKLYNPDKVNDGKQAKDLYERLREAIDRSREMYDQRVDAPVANRFDYFHYELVNGLAEGDESRLGAGYPGSHA